jgi:hypothetical protein
MPALQLVPSSILLLPLLAMSGCFGAGSAKAATCDWLGDLPSEWVPETGSPTYQFRHEGCRWLLEGFDVTNGDSYHERVTFSPPILLLDASAPFAAWTLNGTGSFVAPLEFRSNLPKLAPTLKGTYNATVMAVGLDALGAPIHQWASGARASTGQPSEATGKPNSRLTTSNATAWMTPPGSEREEWLELSFDQAVAPWSIRVWEMDLAGVVERIEARATGDDWRVLWAGRDTTRSFPGLFEPDLPVWPAPVRDVRLVLRTLPEHPHGVDAVELVGGSGWLLRIDVAWDSADVEVCEEADCVGAAPQPKRSLSFYVDTSTGRLMDQLPSAEAKT